MYKTLKEDLIQGISENLLKKSIGWLMEEWNLKPKSLLGDPTSDKMQKFEFKSKNSPMSKA